MDYVIYVSRVLVYGGFRPCETTLGWLSVVIGRGRPRISLRVVFLAMLCIRVEPFRSYMEENSRSLAGIEPRPV